MAAQAVPPPAIKANKSSTAPVSLSLPATHFAKLSPHAFLAAHLPSSRPSRRSPSTARPPTIHTGSLTHPHGSAIVRVGDTAAVCGVRGEILHARGANAMTVLRGGGGSQKTTKDADTIADLGLLVPNIELATGCNPQHLPGNPPSTLAQSLTQRVLTLLRISDLLALEDLQIWARDEDGGKGKRRKGDGDAMDEDNEEENGEDDDYTGAAEATPLAFWTLYIDILVISLDGSPFDAAWAAVLAALKDTTLPAAWWDRDREGVLCDPRLEYSRRLSIRGLPVALSFAVFAPPAGGTYGAARKKKSSGDVYVLVDPDDFEEGCCAQGVTVVVDGGKETRVDAGPQGGSVLRVEMSGGELLGWAEVRALVERAQARWEEWRAVFNSVEGSNPATNS